MGRRVFRDLCLAPKKNTPEGRKSTHRTSPIRGANPPADAITLRCNHSTSHVKGRSRAASGPRQGAKNTQRYQERACLSNFFIFDLHQKVHLFMTNFRNFLHVDSSVGTYNFFISQRPALILSGNQIQTYSNRIIRRNSQEPA